MKDYILFGAGQFGIMALKALGKDHVKCFVDNSRIGNVDGVPIIRAEILKDYYEEGIKIIITPKNMKAKIEISVQLELLDIKNYCYLDDILIEQYASINSEKLLINLGAGAWECPGWTNLDYSTQWYEKAHSNKKYIEYNIREDDIPYDDNTVSCIYCSHVIEHIEDEHDEKMMKECFRVLKKGGVLRIACPDAEFIWKMTKTVGKEWWSWRKRWCQMYGVEWNSIRPVDLLVREIATPRMKGYGKLYGTENAYMDYENAFMSMSMEDFLKYITKELEYDEEKVGDHINYWTFEKLENTLKKAGFRTVVRSRYLGSVSANMQIKEFFDLTEPGMSLYVEAIK